jgi:hypothetical protein
MNSRLKCCPLCKGKEFSLFEQVREKQYWQCSECDLVFLSPEFHLQKQQEKNRYSLHNNCIEDQGYCNFLRKLMTPLQQKITKNMQGLDYGSGPEPILSQLMQQDGYLIQPYDPFFLPNEEILNQNYDFITCSEVVEHFYNPHKEFYKLDQLLKSKGTLGVMTELRTEEMEFKKWWYIQDETHVCFYSKQTMKWIAKQYQYQVTFISNSVILFSKTID